MGSDSIGAAVRCSRHKGTVSGHCGLLQAQRVQVQSAEDDARYCGTEISAAQRLSRDQPFDGVSVGRIKTSHSLRSGSTIEMGNRSAVQGPHPEGHIFPRPRPSCTAINSHGFSSLQSDVVELASAGRHDGAKGRDASTQGARRVSLKADTAACRSFSRFGTKV